MMKENIGGLMSRVYNSLKLKIQDTLQWAKINSMPLARVKSTNALSLNHEMEGLEKLVADRIGKLKAAVKAGEAMVEEARQAEHLAGNLKADITALEAKLKEMEETIRRKDFSRQKMEETLTAEIKNLQNDLKKKDETLATLGNEINDYKSKIDNNVKQIAELELANRNTTEEAASHAKQRISPRAPRQRSLCSNPSLRRPRNSPARKSRPFKRWNKSWLPRCKSLKAWRKTNRSF